jgi:hypothetical protein
LAPGNTVQLTISGTGFETGSIVRVCRKGLSINNVTILDSGTILAEVSVPAGQAEGLCGVRIDNPDGERVVARNVITISASETLPPPTTNVPLTFSSVSPNVLTPGSTIQLTISGTGFEAGSTVQVCRNSLSLNSVTFLNSETIQAEVIVPANQPGGLCGVRIDNPGGGRVIDRNVITILAG